MQIRRLCGYVVATWATTLVGGFLPGMIRAAFEGRQVPFPPWINALQSLLVLATALYVFIRYGKVQTDRLGAHAAVLWLLLAATSSVNLALGQSPAVYAKGVAVFALLVTLGVNIGKRLRSDRQIGDSTTALSTDRCQKVP